MTSHIRGMIGNGKILRGACYERVSTEEQAVRGYSVDAQIDSLNEYCAKNKIKIVSHYTDAGISGAKPPLKRPALQRLIEDVEAGKIDVILFTKLDRWFRSVAEYFKVQEILERHRVEWKAIHEDYDTTTANGRMAITIFMAIAQNEREKAAERIKTVFDHKRKNKESFFGHASLPFGYIEEEDEDGIRRLVKNPEVEDALQEFFDLCVKYDNISNAARTINLKYGMTRGKHKWHELTKKEIYTGTYKGVEDYCPAYISKKDWDKLQNKGNIRIAKNNRIYLFTGLIECPECGNNLRAQYCKQTRKSGEVKEYYSYKCPGRDGRICGYKNTVSQLKIEAYLLDNLERFMKDEIARIEIEKTKPRKKPKTNIQSLKEQLRRLEIVYMAGNKTDEEYIKEQNELNTAIKKAETEIADAPENKDVSVLQETLETDFKSIYESFEVEDKRRFWRTLIHRIYIEGREVKSIEFN